MNKRHKKQEDGDRTPPPAHKKSDHLLGAFLLLMGVFGLFSGAMGLNGRAIRFVILEGVPAIMMSTACMIGAAVIFAGVAEQGGSKKSGRNWDGFRWFGNRVGWGLAVSALVTHLMLKLID